LTFAKGEGGLKHPSTKKTATDHNLLCPPPLKHDHFSIKPYIFIITLAIMLLQQGRFQIGGGLKARTGSVKAVVQAAAAGEYDFYD
jgi:hypothetical protein